MSEEAAVTIVEPAAVPASTVPAESVASRLLPELPDYMEIAMRNLKDDTDFGTRNLSAEEKATFCRVYGNGGTLQEACDAIDISFPTMYAHLDRDPDFQSMLSLVKANMGDKLQSFSYKMAFTPKGTFDRGIQLKRLFPSVYRNSEPQNVVGLSIHVGYSRRSRT